ncbi:hypothetical protein [Nocardioides zeae]
MTWKEGVGEVSWSLVLFVAGALALGARSSPPARATGWSAG